MGGIENEAYSQCNHLSRTAFSSESIAGGQYGYVGYQHDFEALAALLTHLAWSLVLSKGTLGDIAVFSICYRLASISLCIEGLALVLADDGAEGLPFCLSFPPYSNIFCKLSTLDAVFHL